MMAVSAQTSIRESPRSVGLSVVGKPADAAHVFHHLTTDTLEKLSLHNPTPLKLLIDRTLSPPAREDSSEPAIDEEKVSILLRTLTNEFARLDKHNASAAIIALLDFGKWSTISPRVTELYIQFCNVLVSGSPKWWTEIAKRVAKQLHLPHLDHAPHHAILSRILLLVPTATTSFAQVLAEGFPHKTSSSDSLCTYTRNLLVLLEYAPEQTTAVWQLIVQKLVEIDVECDDADAEESDGNSSDSDGVSDLSDEDEDEDEDENSDLETETEAETTAVPSGEQDTSHTGTKRSSDATDFDESPAKRLEEIQEGETLTAFELALSQTGAESASDKADKFLVLLLNHFEHVFTPDAVRKGEATGVFKSLLSVFKSVVLPTACPQAVQYIWFYITSAHSDFEAAFIATLLETVMDDTVGMDLRCRAMQYIASYVARSKSLSFNQVEYVVTFLTEYVTKFVDERESEVDSSLSMAKFRLFYAANQALFYIFMFRHAMLRGDHNGWVANIDKIFQRLISTKFNPLQYCMPDVVAMFAQIAQHEEVASCYSIIERNRWGRFRTGSDNTRRRSEEHNGLFAYNRDSKLYDGFFPYQPLRLPASKQYVSDLYIEWNAHEFSDSDSEFDRSD